MTMWQSGDVTLYQGDCLEMLKTLPDGCVHCVVTSPPYWAMRNYGVPGQLGLEPTIKEYVANLVAVFQEVRRVLRDDGTLWLNMGDCYSGSWGAMSHTPGSKNADRMGYQSKPANATIAGLKPKQLVGMPWRVAFALQADGWYLRRDIIWHKLNPMPESVTDRPTTAHEYIFLLSKSERYFYDAEAVREPQTGNAHSRGNGITPKSAPTGGPIRANTSFHAATAGLVVIPGGRNKRSVWSIACEGFHGDHFAVFPQKLVDPCILAGTSAHGCCPYCGAPWVRVIERTTEPRRGMRGSRFDAGKTARRDGGNRTQPGERYETRAIGWRPSCKCNAGKPVPCTVLDPFGGSGTTAVVAVKHGRRAILIELNPEYCGMAQKRIAAAQAQLRLPLVPG